jgi:hypothetical protein
MGLFVSQRLANVVNRKTKLISKWALGPFFISEFFA